MPVLAVCLFLFYGTPTSPIDVPHTFTSPSILLVVLWLPEQGQFMLSYANTVVFVLYYNIPSKIT